MSSKLSEIISKYAPAAGSLLNLALPGSGLILQGIASLFGANSASEDDIIEKIQQDPEAALKLVTFEKEHAQAMLALTLQDVQNARQREIEITKSLGKRDWFIPFLAFFVLFGYFTIMGFLFFVNIDPDSKEIVHLLFVQASSMAMLVLTFFFGASIQKS
jgi:hypothetical protein